MDWASNEAVGVLAFLLPGFVAAGVFHALTAHPRPDALAQVVRALVFTAVGYATTATILWLASLCPWFAGFFRGGTAVEAGSSENAKTVLLFGVTILWGLAAAWASNKDWIHRLLRRLGATRETSYPSELHSAFASQPHSYVVLHLKGGRRLYGWPDEWPRRAGEGHFRISEAEWLLDDGKTKPAEGVAAILVGAGEVDMIEFMREHPEPPARR